MSIGSKSPGAHNGQEPNWPKGAKNMRRGGGGVLRTKDSYGPEVKLVRVEKFMLSLLSRVYIVQSLHYPKVVRKLQIWLVNERGEFFRSLMKKKMSMGGPARPIPTFFRGISLRLCIRFTYGLHRG